MSSSRAAVAVRQHAIFFALVGALSVTAAEAAAHVDRKDPRRAVGREDDVRVDVQFLEDSISSGSSIHLDYEVENLTPAPVAIAVVPAATTFDSDTRTITVSVGSEIPSGPTLPGIVMIKPGETKSFSGGAAVHVAMPSSGERTRMPIPRYVQVKVNVLRDLAPFQSLQVEPGARAAAVRLAMTDALFEQWVNSNTAVITNAVPIYWGPGAQDVSDSLSASNSGATQGRLGKR